MLIFTPNTPFHMPTGRSSQQQGADVPNSSGSSNRGDGLAKLD